MLRGLSVSPGIEIGRAYVYSNELKISEGFIEIEEVQAELERFDEAVACSKRILLQISEKCNVESEEGKIITAHGKIIEDPVLRKMVVDNIINMRMNAETALKTAIKNLEESFLKMKSEYMQQRAVDIKDVGNRIIKVLSGIKEESQCELDECIIIAKDLMPSDIMRFNRTGILGIISEDGGTTSHVAIIARSLGIPAVAQAASACDRIKTGDKIIVDGNSGRVFVNPDTGILDEYQEKKESFAVIVEENKKLAKIPAITKNGKRIVLGANIGGPEDIKAALENGAEKIGLFRTEFMYMAKNRLPNEEEQYEIYKSVIEGMNGKAVVIRTLDVGGDKSIPYLNIQKEDNPFLGVRGIRFCLRNKDIFRTQIRAILRSSGLSEVTILLPMVSSLAEVKEAKLFIEQVKMELQSEGATIGEDIKIGTMIEVPSSALIIDELAEIVDYFSIGTNDLCQYVLAIDRTNKSLNQIYDSKHPAIIKLIGTVVREAHKTGKKVGICGEMGGDTEYTEILTDMGVDELSMNATAIPEVKKKINGLA